MDAIDLTNLLPDLHARRDDLVARNVCGICGKPPTFTGEYQISGTCEPCFDDLFPTEDDSE